MNHPVVLVVSNCAQTPVLDVIAKIRKLPNDDNKLESDGLKFYNHKIITKYYNTEIAFCPVENTDNIPETVRTNIEGFIFYFDSTDRSVLEKLPACVAFIKAHGIEFSMMLCKELKDDDKSGVTFKCIKDCYNMLDIIELEKSSSDEEDDDDPFNPSGYEELAQALRSVIWSNVDVNHVSSNGKSQVSNGLLGNQANCDDELNVETELENFEKLLSQMMQFRSATSEMNREDQLNCAQGFAEIFEKLISQDEDVNQLNND